MDAPFAHRKSAHVNAIEAEDGKGGWEGEFTLAGARVFVRKTPPERAEDIVEVPA